MANNQTIDGWVTLKRYCELTGETRAAVHTRVSAGHWTRGVHYSAPDGGAAWINLDEVEAWLTGEREKPLKEPSLEAASGIQAISPFSTPEDVTLYGATSEPVTTFTAYIPEVMQADENAPPLYANLTGMDIPVPGLTGSVLGPLTAEAKSARQFVHAVDCVKWCEDNLDNTYFCSAVELPYV